MGMNSQTVKIVHKSLTAEERDYWLRLNHRLVSTKKSGSKWIRKENGELMGSECPVCGKEGEDAAKQRS